MYDQSLNFGVPIRGRVGTQEWLIRHILEYGWHPSPITKGSYQERAVTAPAVTLDAIEAIKLTALLD